MLSTFLSLGVIPLTLCDTPFIVDTVASVNTTELESKFWWWDSSSDEEDNISVAHAERPASHQRLSFFYCKGFSPRVYNHELLKSSQFLRSDTSVESHTSPGYLGLDESMILEHNLCLSLPPWSNCVTTSRQQEFYKLITTYTLDLKP